MPSYKGNVNTFMNAGFKWGGTIFFAIVGGFCWALLCLLLVIEETRNFKAANPTHELKQQPNKTIQAEMESKKSEIFLTKHNQIRTTTFDDKLASGIAAIVLAGAFMGLYVEKFDKQNFCLMNNHDSICIEEDLSCYNQINNSVNAVSFEFGGFIDVEPLGIGSFITTKCFSSIFVITFFIISNHKWNFMDI